MYKRKTFDPIWQEIYKDGRQINLYPWDVVVSFIFRYAPKDRDRNQVRILEVGCGTASNLWFAAREGFSVTGVDASESAINTAKQSMAKEGLTADLRVADFTCLPMEDEISDLAIDRAAITNCGYTDGAKAISEVRRVLKPKGFFFFNPYAHGHSSQNTGKPGPDGVVVDISGGTLSGVGQISFYSEDKIRSAFANGWKIVSMRHLALVEKITGTEEMHSEWRVIAQKT